MKICPKCGINLINDGDQLCNICKNAQQYDSSYYEQRKINRSTGLYIKEKTKSLIIKCMQTHFNHCHNGLSQTKIFKGCNLGWGDKKNTTETQQQFWVVALLKELEEENKQKLTAV